MYSGNSPDTGSLQSINLRLRFMVLLTWASNFSAMDSYFLNAFKTVSAARLFICGWSKFVTGFLKVDDLILFSFQIILGHVSLFRDEVID